MEVTQAFLADFANIDAVGKVNAMGVFGQIVAPEFPAPLPSFAFVIVFDMVGDTDHDRTLRVTVTGGDEPYSYLDDESPMKVPFSPNGVPVTIAQLVSRFDGLVLNSPGLYYFDVFIDGELKRRTQLRAFKQEELKR